MQYCSAIILLHRSEAQFGTSGDTTTESIAARRKCVANACQIAQILQNYQLVYGSVSTMSGVALHAIATATTTLIAHIAESRGKGDCIDESLIVNQLGYLKQCMRALGQLEKSYHVTRRVRKIIQLVMQVSNLDLDQLPSDSFITPLSGPSSSAGELQMNRRPLQMFLSDSAINEAADDLLMESWDSLELTGPFATQNFTFPSITQYDFMHLYEPCYGGV